MRAPLFVVADGMGGAQAGEVASEMAVELVRRPACPTGRPPTASCHIIEQANRAIHDRSRTDTKTRRHGHDRHRGLRRRARGHDRPRRRLARLRAARRRPDRLTKRPLAGRRARRARQADRGAGGDAPAAVGHHPRARLRAGRRRRRRVYQARAGDVFMLNSDGLTSMVPEPRVKEIIEARRLARAGRARADRRRQRGRRARQHHRDPVPARGGRRRARRRSPARPPSTTRGRARPPRSRARASRVRNRPPATRRRPNIAGRGRWPCPRSNREPSRSRSRRGAPRRCRKPRARSAGAAIPGAAIAVADRPRDRPGGPLDRLPRRVLRRRRRRHGDRHDLPRRPVRAPVRDQALRARLHAPACGSSRSPPLAAPRSPTTSCGRATTPRPSSSSWRGAGSSDRSQPRAAGAHPGVTAPDRRLRGDLHPGAGRRVRTSR